MCAAKPTLSDEDLALIHALQLRPRASWHCLGEALGLDSVTVSRRWARLSRAGMAWVAASPGPQLWNQICLAYVTLFCAPRATASVSNALCQIPQVITVQRPATQPGLLTVVVTRDLPEMSGLAADRLARIDGVTDIRTRIVTRVFTDSARWRINALTPAQRIRLASKPAPEPTIDSTVRGWPAGSPLVPLLLRDGRASYQALAGWMNISASTVKRRIDRLVAFGLLRFACDFARPMGGWSAELSFSARVAPSQFKEIATALAGRPEIRNCMAVAGSDNLLLEASLRSTANLLDFETQISTEHPGLAITERSVILGYDKRRGHILDAHGRSVGFIAPGLWPDASRVDVLTVRH